MGRDQLSRRPVQEADLAVLVQFRPSKLVPQCWTEAVGLQAEELRALLVQGRGLPESMGPSDTFTTALVAALCVALLTTFIRMLAHPDTHCWPVEAASTRGVAFAEPVRLVKFIGPSLARNCPPTGLSGCRRSGSAQRS